jgi:hypothetical protein
VCIEANSFIETDRSTSAAKAPKRMKETRATEAALAASSVAVQLFREVEQHCLAGSNE